VPQLESVNVVIIYIY